MNFLGDGSARLLVALPSPRKFIPAFVVQLCPISQRRSLRRFIKTCVSIATSSRSLRRQRAFAHSRQTLLHSAFTTTPPKRFASFRKFPRATDKAIRNSRKASRGLAKC